MPSSISLLLRSPKETILYVWQHSEGDVSLKLDPGVNADWLVERYPRRLAPWTVSVEDNHAIILQPAVAAPTARVFEIVESVESA